MWYDRERESSPLHPTLNRERTQPDITELLKMKQHMILYKNICTAIIIILTLLALSGCMTISATHTKTSVVFLLALPPSAPLICPQDQGNAQDSFVGNDKTLFIYQGKPFKLSGYAFYPAQIGGSVAWRTPEFTHYIDHILDMGTQAGQNLIRPTDFWDASYHVQQQDDITIWNNLDYLVCTAKQRGMFVDMDLSAFGHFLVSQKVDPYKAENWLTFLDAVGKHYADQSSIAFYSILGEPPPPKDPTAMYQLVDFYRAVTDELRKADGNHLIAAGGFNHMEEETLQTPWWQNIYSLPNNNIAAFKTYSRDDLNLIPKISAFAKGIEKPLVDEEFGLPQSMGDATSTGEVYNDLQISRSQFYEDVYSLGEQTGVVGFAFWDMGDEVRSQSYQVNPDTPAVWRVIQRFAPNKVTVP